MYYIFLLKTADRQGGVNFDPMDMIRAILIEVYRTMLHTKNLMSGACDLREKDFKSIYYNIFLWKTADPLCGADFDPRDMIWAILAEVH